MKKAVFLLAIVFGTSGYLFSNNAKKVNTLPQGDQKEKTEKAKQHKKYNFSLFKIISPVKVKESDSTKTTPPKRKFKVIPKEESS